MKTKNSGQGCGKCRRRKRRGATCKQCHTPQLYKQIERVVSEGTGYLDADTRGFDEVSWMRLCMAPAPPCQAIDLIMRGEVSNAFVPVRPPGHHATAERAMGFCLFNNVAVAARYAQNHYSEIERVAIIDWDVHHGNGTQGVFYDDPTVFFFQLISIRGIPEPEPEANMAWAEVWVLR